MIRPTLSPRLASERRREILRAEVSLALLRAEKTEEGTLIRRFFDLKLALHRSPVFALTFSVLARDRPRQPVIGRHRRRAVDYRRFHDTIPLPTS